MLYKLQLQINKVVVIFMKTCELSFLCFLACLKYVKEEANINNVVFVFRYMFDTLTVCLYY